MPSFRKPKGSYTRSTPDWFINDCAYQGSRLALGGPNSTNINLINDSSTGEFMHVFGIDISIQATGVVLIGPGYPYPLQSPTGKSSSVVADNPDSFGTIDQAFFAPGAIPFVSENVYQLVLFPGCLQWQWPHEYAFAVIPAGYCLIVSAEPATLELNASFWYRIGPERF